MPSDLEHEDLEVERQAAEILSDEEREKMRTLIAVHGGGTIDELHAVLEALPESEAALIRETLRKFRAECRRIKKITGGKYTHQQGPDPGARSCPGPALYFVSRQAVATA